MLPTSTNPRPRRLTSLGEATSRLQELLTAVRPENRPLGQVVGKVLAADVVVDTDLPRAAVAYTDGWAVRAAEIVGASAYGSVPLAMPPRWVDADEPMPEGDAILPPDELVLGTDGTMEAVASVALGQGVRLPGHDAPAGTVVMRQGTRLTALHVAVLRACGADSVDVRVPRVRVVLATDAAKLHSFTLSAWLASAGAEVAEIVNASGEGRDLAALYGSDDVDLIVSVGGTGQGRNDRAVAALAVAGSVEMHGIALRPGMSAGFGWVRSTCVLLLPGRIDSLLASLLVLGRPALAGLTGLVPDDALTQSRLADKVTSAVGLSEVFLASRSGDDIRPAQLAEARLDTISGASGWFLVPPQREGIAAGETVRWQQF